ncbi:hypothetical protein [Lactobacillus sp. PV034]|uniref:hypothetical protein n=1 Tax=Lactobacillus sp. PV034 TaxID=2594495 RepID=UPI00223F4540|nr:hypothetical protein [Lactobacillus sp. PV034]QNQ80999.1 hypothetical protein FP432_05245 [Lactobacillus sp. PV034]
MDEKQEVVKKSKKHVGAIISWIIAILIIIIIGGVLYFHFSKPSAADALNSAAKTKINSVNSTIVLKQSKNNSETLTYQLKGDTIHLTNRFTPANKAQEQETWITGDKFYFLNNKKWNYMKRNTLTNTFIANSTATYKKLFTSHNFSKLSNSAKKKFNVNYDGLTGYTLTYQGNDKDVIKGIQKAISDSDTNDSSQIKNADVTIKINRHKELLDYKVLYTFTNGKESTVIHVTDINKVASLTLPKEVKNATEIATPNLR